MAKIVASCVQLARLRFAKKQATEPDLLVFSSLSLNIDKKNVVTCWQLSASFGKKLLANPGMKIELLIENEPLAWPPGHFHLIIDYENRRKSTFF